MIIAGIVWNDIPQSLRETIVRSVERKPMLAMKLIDQTKMCGDGRCQYEAEQPRVQLMLESIARGLLFHEIGVIYEDCPRIVITNFLGLSEEAPINLRNGNYELVQAMCETLLLEYPEHGENKEVFSYRCASDIVQFKFYRRLLATVGFGQGERALREQNISNT